MAGIGTAPTWLSRAVYAQAGKPKAGNVLVVIFQRGAVDGLNMVVPHFEPAYYAARPGLAIPRPAVNEQSAIDLDGRFGLHPALASLKPIYDSGQLAIIHACGSPDPTRSHFDAQDYMESGTPGVKSTASGWLNRALAGQPHTQRLRAVSISPALPRALRGPNDALAMGNLSDFQVRDPAARALFEKLYSQTADPLLHNTAREAFEASAMLQSVERQPYAPAAAAKYPKAHLGQSLQQVARLIKADVGLEVAFVDVGGWDTHANQAGPQPHTGQLANRLREFSDSLAAFATDLGDRMSNVVVVTMSEFGRTVRENGNRGTDHGHANVMFVLGGSVRGGIHGAWPGLESEQLYDGRDLAVTTDFRAVLSEVVIGQLGKRDVTQVFPRYILGPSLRLLRA